MNFKEAADDLKDMIANLEAVKGKQFADTAQTLAGAQPIIIGIELVAHGVMPASALRDVFSQFLASAVSQLCQAHGLDAQEIADAATVFQNKMQQHAAHIKP